MISHEVEQQVEGTRKRLFLFGEEGGLYFSEERPIDRSDGWGAREGKGRAVKWNIVFKFGLIKNCGLEFFSNYFHGSFSFLYVGIVIGNCGVGLAWMAGSLHEGNRLTMMVGRTRNPHLSMATDRERGIDGWMLSIDWLLAGLLKEEEE